MRRAGEGGQAGQQPGRERKLLDGGSGGGGKWVGVRGGRPVGAIALDLSCMRRDSSGSCSAGVGLAGTLTWSLQVGGAGLREVKMHARG